MGCSVEKKKDLVLIGSGGLAREVRWLVDECNKGQDRWNLLGLVSNEKPGTVISGLSVLGDDKWLIDYDKPIDVAICIGSGIVRKQVAERLIQNPNINFPTIISPSAELSETVVLGKGNIITSKNVLTVDIKTGDFFFCNLACTIGHDCIIRDYVTLNPGVNVSGNVVLGENVTIGTGAAIIQGVAIGDNSTVGAGAVVIDDIDSNCTAVGIPARPLEKKDE